MSNGCEGKASWPELLGLPGNEAVTTFEKGESLVTAIILPPGTVPIADFRCDRVWVYVDGNDNVRRVPSIG
ncbi:hypothetical protein Pfo_027996 [Paulownia fortunei]|nr:hypothetical protein Pfo_027996 [Paulownia fortunei]